MFWQSYAWKQFMLQEKPQQKQKINKELHQGLEPN